MATAINPEIGACYKNLEGESFEVIAIDEQEGIVEIQYFDGAVEELDTDTWYELELIRRERSEEHTSELQSL